MNHVRSRDGTAIAFERTGEGPPVVVVGGAFNDRATGAPIAERLRPPDHRSLEGQFQEIPLETLAPVLATFFAGTNGGQRKE